MDWYTDAQKLKAQGKGIVEISKILGIPYKTVESRFYRDNLRGNIITKKPEQQPINLQDSILKDISKECAISYLCDKYKVSERVIRATIEDIKEAGYILTDENDKVKLCTDILYQDNKHEEEWNGERIIRFGLAGDKQFNSKYIQLTALHSFYDICECEGITTVYDPGDIDEGEEMRLGHKYECYTQGADDHVKEIAKNHPQRKGITTKFISGNHDHSIIKRCGYDIGYAIQALRPDMVYLGQSNAVINLTPNCTMELRHPIDGTAYAISYKTQKMIDAMQGGEKPNILAVGHYHKAEYLFYRNVHCFQTGTFQAQTPFMRNKGIAAHVGGWIVEAHVDEEGTITRCKGEFIPYYKMIKDDYMNWR